MFNCFFCDSELMSYCLLKRHVSVFHKSEAVSHGIVCKQNKCTRSFGTIHSLYSHIRSIHLNENRAFIRSKKNRGNFFSTGDSEINSEKVEDEQLKNINFMSCSRSSSISRLDGKEKELTFLNNLYRKPHFSRKDIDDVIQNVRLLEEGNTEMHFEGLETESKRVSILKRGICI